MWVYTLDFQMCKLIPTTSGIRVHGHKCVLGDINFRVIYKLTENTIKQLIHNTIRAHILLYITVLQVHIY